VVSPLHRKKKERDMKRLFAMIIMALFGFTFGCGGAQEATETPEAPAAEEVVEEAVEEEAVEEEAVEEEAVEEEAVEEEAVEEEAVEEEAEE
jgi:hypothetical protein